MLERLFRITEEIYCAFCRVQRRVYSKKHVDWTNVILSSLAAMAIMLVLWQDFDARVFIIFVVCISAAETFIQIRWRLSIPCPYCGFDAMVYLKDKTRAVEIVKATLERQQASSEMWLSEKNPFRHLPKRRLSEESKGSSLPATPTKKESLLSKQV